MSDTAPNSDSPKRTHEEFLELCALSTSGELRREERQLLDQHLAECAECRQAMSEFETIVDKGVAALASDLADELVDIQSEWSVEEAYANFLKRLSRDNDQLQRRL